MKRSPMEDAARKAGAQIMEWVVTDEVSEKDVTITAYASGYGIDVIAYIPGTSLPRLVRRDIRLVPSTGYDGRAHG